MPENTKVYVGIDLGTTNTLVSYIKKGKTNLIKFESKNVLPSVMYINPDGEMFIGEEAKGLGQIDPNNKVRSSKTYMGTDKKYVFDTAKGRMEFTPTNVATEILKAAKAKIEKKFKLEDGDEIYAVITTPAAFSFAQNEETKQAAKDAGLNVLGIRSEPVAATACIDSIEPGSKVFVVDIGGGTYDTALITYDNNLNPTLVSTEGDRRLGGDNFDAAIFEYLKQDVEMEFGLNLESQDESGLDYTEYNKLLSTLVDCATEVKEELTQADDVTIERNNLYTIKDYNDDKPVPYSTTVTIDEFNDICSEIYDKIADRLDKSIADINKRGYKLSDITHLVLVGGTCYIPKVIEIIENKIGMKSIPVADKTTAVAEGAAYIADSWTTLGASLGGIISQSMGVKVKGEKFSKIVEKGTTYPFTPPKSKIYTTAYDNQTSVGIAVYAAAPDKEDVETISEHEYYGFFKLENIEKAPKGVPQIKVDFYFDYDQTLLVTATDLKTNATNEIKITKGAFFEEEKMTKPTSIDLLIDVSGSMRGRELIDAQNACRKMIKEIVDLKTNDMGITTFNNTANNICKLTNDQNLLLASVNTMSASGGTMMGQGVLASYEKLKASSNDEKIIFLMTDGAPNSGDKSRDIASQIRKEGNVKLAVIYIGSSNSSGYEYANEVAKANVISDEEKVLFYTSNDMSDLGNIFKKIYADITEMKD